MVDLLELIIKISSFATKQATLMRGVNCTEPSPSVSVLNEFMLVGLCKLKGMLRGIQATMQLSILIRGQTLAIRTKPGPSFQF